MSVAVGSSPDLATVWFAIPSANPENCRRVLPKWREMGYRTAVLQNRTQADIPADICVWSDHYPGWGGSINQLCADIVPSSASIVVSGGDDMLPDPTRPAHILAAEFMQRFPDGFGVMQPMGDVLLGAGRFCGSPWLGRGWIRRAYQARGPMWPGYRHNWADNELYWVARCLGVLWERPDLSQPHQHFTRTGEPKPAYWTDTVESADEADVRQFIARAWLGFPGHEPAAAVSSASPIRSDPSFDRKLFESEYLKTAEKYWYSRYASKWLVEPEALMRGALSACQHAGEDRVAIYGAGTHTMLAARALAELPGTVSIRCVIDDSPSALPTMWGLPVIPLAQAAKLASLGEIDAVIVSSQTMESRLAERARGAMPRSIAVRTLYQQTESAMSARKPSPQTEQSAQSI